MPDEGVGFDPRALTADASLNQVVIEDVPGAPGGVPGRTGAEVCSRDALLDLATAAGLRDLDPARVGDRLAAAATSAEGAARQAAEHALEVFGAGLGAVVATVRRPATPGRQGRTPVRRAYLEHWLVVERVWLAGGLLRGAAGDIVARAARGVVARADRPCPVGVVAHPEMAPLIGAARFASTGDGTVVVADLGHTTIKTAVVAVEAGTVSGLEQLEAVPAPRARTGHEVAAAVSDALRAAAVHPRVRAGTHLEIVASVASYLSCGLPVDDGRSVYGGLGRAVADMTGGLVAASGRPVTLRFVHDGTAAAAASGERAVSAVVTAGSWLGIGFTPSSPDLLALGAWAGLRAPPGR